MHLQKLRELRVCRTCKEEKSLSEYGVRRASKDGLMTQCKECNKKAQRVQYSSNKKYYLDRNRELRASNRERYKKTKEGKPCTRCGGLFPQVCMDYDHIDHKSKRLCVAQMMGYSWNVIQKEIDKCELVCANCHRIKTYETSTRQKQHRITTSHKRPKRKCPDRRNS